MTSPLSDDATVAVRRCAVFYFKHPTSLSLEVVAAAAAFLAETRSSWRFSFVRSAADVRWSELKDFTQLAEPESKQWMLELCSNADRSECKLSLLRSPPWRGAPMASQLTVEFPDDVTTVELAAFGTWAISFLPLWWGSLGLFFLRRPRWGFDLEDKATLVAARRRWAVQILDPVLLQRDALLGMPGVNWLTLIGNDFAKANGQSVETLAANASGLVHEGVFHRLGTYGLALAAGPKPLVGDINIGEDLSAYERIAALVQPLLLQMHTPLSGPFARPEVMAAWLTRFTNPQGWLGCDLDAD